MINSILLPVIIQLINLFKIVKKMINWLLLSVVIQLRNFIKIVKDDKLATFTGYNTTY